jgi:hypothetical protein
MISLISLKIKSFQSLFPASLFYPFILIPVVTGVTVNLPDNFYGSEVESLNNKG